MSSRKYRKPAPSGNFTYSVPIKRENGRRIVWIGGEKIEVVNAEVPANAIYYWPDNERFSDDEIKDTGRPYSKAHQKRIEAALDSERRAKSNDRLEDSFLLHGGQNEPILVVNYDGEHPLSVEGNRRLFTMRQLGYETANADILPDQISEDLVMDYLVQQHIGGKETWGAMQKARVAHKYLVERGEDLDTIRRKGGYTSNQKVKAVITGYMLWKKSGLPEKDFSKFEKATHKTWLDLFGFNFEHYKDDSPIFAEHLRDCKSSTASSIEEFDKQVARAARQGKMIKAQEVENFRADFDWFCDLIKSGRLTDCRHSYGLKRVIESAKKPFGNQAIRLLHEQPPSSIKKKAKEEENFTSNNVPAQKAINFVDEQAQKVNPIRKVITDLEKLISDARADNSPHYQEIESDSVLRMKIKTHIEEMRALLSETDPKKRKDVA